MKMLTVIKQPEGIKYIGYECRDCGRTVKLEMDINEKLTDNRCETCKSSQSAIHTPTGRKADTI